MDVSVRLNLVKGDTKLKAISSITIDNAIVIDGVKVVETLKKGEFIAFPSRQKSDGTYSDIAFPITSDARKAIQDAVFEAYDKAKEKAAEQSKEDVEPER